MRLSDPRYPEPDSSNFELYVMDADGSDPTHLTDVPGADGLPIWSPDRAEVLLAACFAVLVLASACGDGGGTDSSSTGDDGKPLQDLSTSDIDIAQADFPLDGYIVPGLMYAIYRADYDQVPDDRFTRTVVLGLVRVLNDACGEDSFIDLTAYMEYAGASTEPEDIVVDLLEGLLEARDFAERGDPVGGLEASMDELGLNFVAPEGIDDGNLLVSRHGCKSNHVAQFRPNLDDIIVSRADQMPTP